MSKKTTEGAIDFACYVDGYISYVNNPMPNIDPNLF